MTETTVKMNLAQSREHTQHIRIVELLKSDLFNEACDDARVKPTRRQAAKYLNRRGLAWAAHKRRIGAV